MTVSSSSSSGSQRDVRREISQILLIHANDINADCLGRDLLSDWEARSYRFVVLIQALEDKGLSERGTITSGCTDRRGCTGGRWSLGLKDETRSGTRSPSGSWICSRSSEGKVREK